MDVPPAEPRKGGAAPGRTPGRAAAPRLRKIFASAASATDFRIPSSDRTPESFA